MITDVERQQIRDLLDEEVRRVRARMNARGRRSPVVVMGIEVPEYRIHELRWQKIEFLLAIKARL